MKLAVPLAVLVSALALSAACTSGGSSDDDDDGSSPTPSPSPSPSGTPTIQIQTPAISVPPGSDLIQCYYTTLPTSEPFDIGSFAMVTTGMAHTILYRTATAAFPDGTLGVCNTGGDAPMWLFGTPRPDDSLTLPDGVGIPMSAAQPVYLYMHLANLGSTEISAQATVTIGLRTEPVTAAGTMLTMNSEISVPPMADGSVSGQCDVPDGAEIFAMTTYSRKHTVSVRVNRYPGALGDLLLETTNWEDPAVGLFSPPLTFTTSEQIAYTCDYDNSNGNSEIQDGDSTTDEACITASYFSPATVHSVCVNSFTLTEPL